MNKYDIAKSLLKKWEGFRADSYLDSVGVPTIGYGRTFGSMSTTSKQAEEKFLDDELLKINQLINERVTRRLNAYQMAALMSLIYNIGSGAFSRSTLLKQLNSPGFTLRKASDQFLVFVRAGGRTLPGLVKRRYNEWEMFNTSSSFDF